MHGETREGYLMYGMGDWVKRSTRAADRKHLLLGPEICCREFCTDCVEQGCGEARCRMDNCIKATFANPHSVAYWLDFEFWQKDRRFSKRLVSVVSGGYWL